MTKIRSNRGSLLFQTCPACKKRFTVEDRGLDDEHCQTCWEDICAEGWWEEVRKLDELGLLEGGEGWNDVQSLEH